MAAATLGALLVGAVSGASKADLLAPGYCPVPGLWAAEPLCPEIAAVAAGSFHAKEPPAIRGSGYVVASLEAALWAFARSESFAAGCLLAVNLGEDADTTAAVYGQTRGGLLRRGRYPGSAGANGWRCARRSRRSPIDCWRWPMRRRPVHKRGVRYLSAVVLGTE